jgi:hypothetical protein
VDSVHHPLTVGSASPRWTMNSASALAYRSSAWQPLWATTACCEGGNAKRVTQPDRGTAHRSLDGGEEAVHWQQSFGSGWQQHGHDEDLEEESWMCGNLHRGGMAFSRAEARQGRAGVPSWLVLKEVFNATSYWRIEEGRGAI